MRTNTKQGTGVQSGTRSAAVRDRLLNVAERLFAEHGIEAVSLNQIARAANQRNTMVIQYHFGSKMALLHAIAERRMEQVNERRVELLNRIDGSSRLIDLRRVAEAMVLPYAEHLTHEGGSHYIRFVAQLYSDPRLEYPSIIKGQHDTGMRQAAQMVREILADLPREVVKHRLALVTTLVFSSFADREKLRAAGRHVGVATLHTAHFVNDLIGVIVEVLNAPYGERTLTEKDIPEAAAG